ncbi:6722_t:CDS:2, partial [Funneliformis geosporum]
THSEINKLLDILAVNWELYKFNKTKFYASAAIKLGRNKTGKQVKGKLFNLRTKYTNEKKEVAGKMRDDYLKSRLEFDREKFEKEFEEKTKERKNKMDLEHEKLRMENKRMTKQIELGHQLRMAELEFK